jgi:hypothetical protein
MPFYSSNPLYAYPFRFLLGTDSIQLIMIFILAWKIYYYGTSNTKTTAWDVVNSTYKTATNIVETINSIINTIFLIILSTYLIVYTILHK